jgi:hypothetical protein
MEKRYKDRRPRPTGPRYAGSGGDIICPEGGGVPWSRPVGGGKGPDGRSGRRDPGAARGGRGRARAGRPLRPLRRPHLRRRDPLPRGPGQAEDLVQDVFLSVWRNAGNFDPSRASFATWIYRITRNRATDLIRRRKARVRTVGVGPAAGARGPGPHGQPLPRLRRRRRALAALPDPPRGPRPRVLRGALAEGDLRPHPHASRHGQEPHHRRAPRLREAMSPGTGRVVSR